MNVFKYIGVFTVPIVMSFVVWAATTTNVLFSNHIQMKIPEQDVFVESSEDDTKVVRVEEKDASKPETLAMEVFATKTVTDHDPFKLTSTPLGPFEKGKQLGFTLGEWLTATGNGTYTVNGDKAEVSLTFEKLIPSGLYTVWCSRLTFPPNAATVYTPCGAADGSENTFAADNNGNGTIFVKLISPLEESTKETVSVLDVVYHSDGKTHGVSPGDFGLSSHVQMTYIMPAKEVAMEPTNTQSDTREEKSTLGLLIIVAILVVGGIWWLKKRTPIVPGDDERA